MYSVHVYVLIIIISIQESPLLKIYVYDQHDEYKKYFWSFTNVGLKSMCIHKHIKASLLFTVQCIVYILLFTEY